MIIFKLKLKEIEIPNQGNLNVNNDLYYNTTHTYYTFQRNNTIHKYGKRISCYTIIILNINEKVIKSYIFKHYII